MLNAAVLDFFCYSVTLLWLYHGLCFHVNAAARALGRLVELCSGSSATQYPASQQCQYSQDVSEQAACANPLRLNVIIAS